MANGRLKLPAAQLWQLPLFLLSLALFGYAGWLFIDPKPGPTLAQKLQAVRDHLDQGRPQPALEELKLLLESNPQGPQRGAVHLLLGEALELGQKELHINVDENHRRIIDHTTLGIALGIEPDANAHRRMAESYEALGHLSEAIRNYRQAVALSVAGNELPIGTARLPEQDDGRSSLAASNPQLTTRAWQKRIIELQLALEDPIAAAASLEEFLAQADLSVGERAWAMGEKAHLLIDGGEFAAARALVGEALKLDENDPAIRGRFSYWMGYSAWKLEDLAEAERHLRVARDQLQVKSPLDADAAYALGQIRAQQKDYPGAISFYNAILQSHADARVAPRARLWRGVCRIADGEGQAGLTDLTDTVHRLRNRRPLPKLREELLAALRQSTDLLFAAEDFKAGLELMGYEQEFQEKPRAEFFARLARLYERRADQLLAIPPDVEPREKAKLEGQSRDARVRAGDAQLALAAAVTLEDDKATGQAMWKAIELYDAAGDLARMISALESFMAHRPEDPRAPDGLLRLGRAYHAAGLFDKCVAAYKRLQFRYPRSLAATKSEVPLARAYIAMGPEQYAKAETVLRGVIESNPHITPEADEFRESLLELANLYHRIERYELAIYRLEELIQRYPDDDRTGQMLFLMADSYRRSARLLEEQIRTGAAQPGEAPRARVERLGKARDLFKQVMDYYRVRHPARELDILYARLSHFYRADCVYDLGDYEQAIRCYDDAAFRYQDDPSALAAYVQIVNANVQLGRTEEAKAANERAKWMLRQMPAEAFTAVSGHGVSRQAWEQWLDWSSKAGLWK